MQPRLVQPAVALRERTRNTRRSRSDILRLLQPERAWSFRTDQRRASRPWGFLPSSGRPGVVSRSGPAAVGVAPRSRRVGEEGNPEHRQFRQILERPHDRGICARDMGPATMPGALERRASGLLLHVTSLPSPYGIGDLGPAAYDWIDRLSE